MPKMLSPLDPSRLGKAMTAERRAHGGWVWQGAHSVSVVAETRSTNADLMAEARDALVSDAPWPERRLHLALRQTAGRGRQARPWTTAVGTAWAWSLGMRLAAPVSALGGLTLACGLGVREGLAGAALGLKWPNDVVLPRPPYAKVGGILVEVVSRGPADVWCVVGLGLNLAGGAVLTEELGRPVGDLGAAGLHLTPDDWPSAIGAVVDAIEARVHQVIRDGFAGMAAAFDAAHVYHGQRALLVEGTQQQYGRVLGVGPAGELGLQSDAGSTVWGVVGELSLRLADNAVESSPTGETERNSS